MRLAFSLAAFEKPDTLYSICPFGRKFDSNPKIFCHCPDHTLILQGTFPELSHPAACNYFLKRLIQRLHLPIRSDRDAHMIVDPWLIPISDIDVIILQPLEDLLRRHTLMAYKDKIAVRFRKYESQPGQFLLRAFPVLTIFSQCSLKYAASFTASTPSSSAV